MQKSMGIAVLAAGKGTRLKQNIAKAIFPAQGKTLVDFVIGELNKFESKNKIRTNINLVVGHLKEDVMAHVRTMHPRINIAFPVQEQQLGTADALKSYFKHNESNWDYDYTLVTCADTPLVSESVYSKLLDIMEKNPQCDAVAATFITKNPHGYGRIIRGDVGFNIVEEKDATDEQRKVTEVNSGVYILKTSHVKKNLFSIDSANKSGEFYLTDLFKKNFHVEACAFSEETQFVGVNTLEQLEMVSMEIQKKKIQTLQIAGVKFINSATCYIEESVQIEAGTTIFPGVTLMGTCRIGSGCVIESGVVIKDSTIGNNTNILANSYLESAQVGNRVQVGPMARLRAGSVISDECKIGNFVETKKVQLAKGVKVSHLSYVGDAVIGENTNIGCGFITCNYDGANKHTTTIGKNSFIGSDCQMIAPISIGDEAYVGSGSTINQDVPDGAFAIARQKQTTREGMAKRFLKIKK